MKYFKRKRLTVLFFIGLILVSYDPILSNGQATSASNQKDNKSPEEPLIVNENTVAFIVLSQKDYDLLISKDPELKAELPDVLDDFYSHSGKISKILDKSVAQLFRWRICRLLLYNIGHTHKNKSKVIFGSYL